MTFYNQLLSPRGAWDNDTQYSAQSVSGAAQIGLGYVSCPLVVYNTIYYYTTGTATLGLIPPNDSAWSILSGQDASYQDAVYINTSSLLLTQSVIPIPSASNWDVTPSATFIFDSINNQVILPDNLQFEITIEGQVTSSASSGCIIDIGFSNIIGQGSRPFVVGSSLTNSLFSSGAYVNTGTSGVSTLQFQSTGITGTVSIRNYSFVITQI